MSRWWMEPGAGSSEVDFVFVVAVYSMLTGW